VLFVFIRTFSAGSFNPLIEFSGMLAMLTGLYLAKPDTVRQIKTPWGLAVFGCVAVLVPTIAWYLIRMH
jgi:hypothetical protein